MKTTTIDSLKQQLLKCHPRDSRHTKILQEIIEKQNEVIEFIMKEYQELEKKFGFIQQDWAQLVSQNKQLKERLERIDMNPTIEFHQFFNKVKESQSNSLIFQQKDYSAQSQLQMIEPNSAQYQHTQLDIIQYMSGAKRVFNSSLQGRTPILYQPIFKDKIYMCKYNFKGLVRAFYIKLLSLPHYIIRLIDFIEDDYKTQEDEGKVLFAKYPDNRFIGDMMIEFLRQVSETTKYSQVVQKLNTYQLFDDILMKIFIDKLLTYQSVPQYLDEETTKRCFWGLANVFELQLQVVENRYMFYEETCKRMYSDQSQYCHQVYEEISLNPKPPKESISVVPAEKREPIFSIECHSQGDCFEFIIRDQKTEEEGLATQQMYLSQSQQEGKPRDFDRQNFSEELLERQQNQVQVQNHFADVPTFFSSPEINESNQLQEENDYHECSVQLFKQFKKNNYNLHRGSKDTILLSGYNSHRASQQFHHFRQEKRTSHFGHFDLQKLEEEEQYQIKSTWQQSQMNYLKGPTHQVDLVYMNGDHYQEYQ